MDYPGKLIRKTPLVPTQTSASGVWTMTEAMDAVKANTWPVAGTPLPMQQSLRTRSSASAYLNRTFTTSGNSYSFTQSIWCKRGTLGAYQTIGYGFFAAGSVYNGQMRFNSNDTLDCYIYYNGSSWTGQLSTTQVFRDPSAWYNIVLAVDTTQATSSNRLKLYVNGVQVTAFSTANYPSQNQAIAWNSSGQAGYYINTQQGSSYFFDGYIAELNYIDGQALTPSSFGRTDPITGVWQAIPYTGTFGTNGFYLPFKNPSNVGADYSGNANNWTANNISTTPTYNYTSYTSGSGTYTVPAGVSNIQYLVVAGGGGAGGNAFNGGGGAGGVLTGSLAVTPGQTISYSVGAGGAGGSGGTNGANGSNSTFGGFTAIGGGAGGSTASGSGASGGSGGGGAGGSSGTSSGGSGTAGQGFAGGTGYGAGSGQWGAGGGGGAGKAGTNGASVTGGAGGAGITWINGTTYGGGGGGAADNPTGGGTAGAGGAGGGGAGSASGAGTSGTANTGGGGGGAYGTNTGGSGGSGIVIVAYQTSASTYDVMADTPTQWLPASTLNGNANARGNYCTLNPLANGTNLVCANGNLSVSNSTTESNHRTCRATIGVTSGKYYWELNVNNSANVDIVGVVAPDSSPNSYVGGSGAGAGWGYSTSGGGFYPGAGWSSSGTAPVFPTSGIIGVALDVDSGKMWFSSNGIWLTAAGGIGVPSTGSNPVLTYTGSATTFFPAVSIYANTGTWTFNFGQRPFSYTPPSGFVALNTYNMSTPTILQGNLYMDATTFTGNASTNVIVNAGGFKPDMVWLKSRSNANNHTLYDSIRGVNTLLYPNLTNAEATGTNQLTSFNSNGFTVGASENSNDIAGESSVGWQWQAGQGTTSSNTNGSITSTVSVNASAGFSVVTYTGTGANATVGHGLGVAPNMIIVKYRGAGQDWTVYHSSLGNTQYLTLNTTNAAAAASTVWQNTTPTSSVFSIGTAGIVNTSGGSGMVAYCFASIAGYSAFGSYTGNGSTDGPFVYLGFRPKFVIIKNASAGSTNWFMYDSARNTYNVVENLLLPNASAAEYSGYPQFYLDFLSNGFKIKATDSQFNGSGNTLIYMAFAENPFKNSLAR